MDGAGGGGLSLGVTGGNYRVGGGSVKRCALADVYVSMCLKFGSRKRYLCPPPPE